MTETCVASISSYPLARHQRKLGDKVLAAFVGAAAEKSDMQACPRASAFRATYCARDPTCEFWT